MKKFIQPVFYDALALISYSNYAQAQDVAFGNKSKSTASYQAADVSIAPTTALPAEQVNPRVLRHFIKSYQGAHNVKWYMQNNLYVACFDEAGMASRASFGKHGFWYCDVRFGTEKDLPADVRKMIKSNYVEYIIGKVTKVTVGNQKAIVVNLEDADNLVLARITENGLDELAHYNTHAKTHKSARIIIPK